MSHHLAIFGSHWSSASGDIKYLTCHMTIQNHVIKGPVNFMSNYIKWLHWVTTSSKCITLLNLMTIGIVVVMLLFCHVIEQCHIVKGIAGIMLLICHVISQDHVIKRSCHFKGRSPSRQAIILPSLVAIGILVGEMIFACHVTLEHHEIKALNDFMVRTQPAFKELWNYINVL